MERGKGGGKKERKLKVLRFTYVTLTSFHILKHIGLLSLLNPIILNSFNPNPECGTEVSAVFCSGMLRGDYPCVTCEPHKHVSISLLCLGHSFVVQPTLAINRRSQSSVLPIVMEKLCVEPAATRQSCGSSGQAGKTACDLVR